jgi:hypothetical protein
LEGEVAEAAEEIIRKNCKELDIEVIDKPFFRKESFTKETVISTKLGFRISPTLLSNFGSWIAKRIKGRSSKTLLEKAFTEKCFAVRDQFPQLKAWCPGHLWAPSCYH